MGTVSTNSTYTFTVTGNRSLTAVFEAVIPTYTITAAIDPPEAGTVTGAGQYQQGTTVTLTAAINDGYSFTGWQENGETVSTDNPYTFTAEGDRAFTAAFAEEPASRLPAGYTEVEYISNPNLGYIQDAGLPQKISDYIVALSADFSNTTNSGNIMGTYVDIRSRSSLGSRYVYFVNQVVSYIRIITTSGKLILNLKQFTYDFSSTQPSTSELAIPSYSLVANKEGKNAIYVNFPQKLFQVNDDETTTAQYTATTQENCPFALFSANAYSSNFGTSASYTYGWNPTNYSLYSMQVIEQSTGTVVNDFVPCVNEEGLAGLYDLVKETFYSSSVAEKPFTAGPEI